MRYPLIFSVDVYFVMSGEWREVHLFVSDMTNVLKFDDYTTPSCFGKFGSFVRIKVQPHHNEFSIIADKMLEISMSMK